MPDTAIGAISAGGSVRSSVESRGDKDEGSKQKTQILQLKFHYTRRMADILREEAENERRI